MTKYDMFTRQNIDVDYNIQTKEYKVLITSQNPISIFEIWNSKKNINERVSIKVSLTQFVDYITAYNLINTVKFMPTTVVDIGTFLHILIMTRAEIDECGNVIFYFKKKSVVFIDSSQNVDSELSPGNYKNVRFDIDPLEINEIDVRIRVKNP
jgi:hypothetical protein